jgi:hypothetical protein
VKFDRVVVVNLARRPDRLADFRSRVPQGFPFGEVEAVDAIDGKRVRHPAWWRQGGGAWGCYRTHLRIIEDALQRGQEKVLIFEDDATFCDGFNAKALAYFDALPRGWLQAYLGGQHLRRPEAIKESPLVLRATNINRTHAYAVNGREGLLALYRHLTDTTDWMHGHHIDHHFGRLHRKSPTGFYTPREWLCGQASGTSDVACKPVEERWWTRTREPVSSESGTFVAVVGLHRSGSSAVAMMLHKLGVSMGDRLGGYEDGNGGGGEAVGLAGICEWAARFPTVGIARPRDEVQRRLSRWIEGRLTDRRIAGGKYPHLCAMGRELLAACGDRLRVIVCDRPLEESIESLQRRSRKSRGWLAVTDTQADAVQRWLWREREDFLAQVPGDRVLRLPWNRTQADPAAAVADIVEFLGIEPTPDQVAAAVGHIHAREVAA